MKTTIAASLVVGAALLPIGGAALARGKGVRARLAELERRVNALETRSVTGPPGASGPKGDKGDPGPPGPKGGKGDRGPGLITRDAASNLVGALINYQDVAIHVGNRYIGVPVDLTTGLRASRISFYYQAQDCGGQPLLSAVDTPVIPVGSAGLYGSILLYPSDGGATLHDCFARANGCR